MRWDKLLFCLQPLVLCVVFLGLICFRSVCMSLAGTLEILVRCSPSLGDCFAGTSFWEHPVFFSLFSFFFFFSNLPPSVLTNSINHPFPESVWQDVQSCFSALVIQAASSKSLCQPLLEEACISAGLSLTECTIENTQLHLALECTTKTC